MDVKINITGLEKVTRQLLALTNGQIQQAAATALNDAAFKTRRTMQDEFSRQFDRVTPYILRTVKVKAATPDKLEATIEPTYLGGKSVDPQKILRAELLGGARRDKRSEILLRKAGILPAGYITATPKVPFPGSDDGRGNLRGPFMVRLISYFQAFGEQGHKANMTARTKKKLADRAKYSSLYNKQTYESARGVQFFVATKSSMAGVHDAKNKTQHLQPGIWAKSGLHGSTGIYRIWPVLMFVRAASYTPRISLERIVKDSDLDNYTSSRLRYRLRQAFEAMQ